MEAGRPWLEGALAAWWGVRARAWGGDRLRQRETGDDEAAFKGQRPERLPMRIRFSDRNF
jgi:hypothetical protein